MSRSKIELIKSVFDKEITSSRWSTEANQVFGTGEELLEKLGSGSDKETQKKIALITWGTLIIAIAADEHPYRPTIRMPGHQFDQEYYYTLNVSQIYEKCGLDVIKASFNKENNKPKSEFNYFIGSNLILRAGELCINSELPLESERLKAAFPQLSSEIDHMEYLIDHMEYLIDGLRVEAHQLSENIHEIPRAVTELITEYTTELSSGKKITPLIESHSLLMKRKEIQQTAEAAQESYAFKFNCLCALAAVSTATLATGIALLCCALVGIGMGLTVVGVLGMAATGYGFFKLSSEHTKTTALLPANEGNSIPMVLI